MNLKAFLFLFALFVSTSKIFACKCIETSVAENIIISDIVFSGEVLSVVTTTNFDSLNIVLKETENNFDFSKFPITAVTIKVFKLFKGNLLNETVIIITPPDSASCGVYFKQGYNFIVYATYGMRSPFEVKCNNKNTFWTHSCTRTRIWDEEEEQAIITELEKLNGKD